jgi:hypothetical protein
MSIVSRIRCWLGWCGGNVVSGIHGDEIWTGWRCHNCGCVKHYAPSRKLLLPVEAD